VILSEKVVGRLSLYRRVLSNIRKTGSRQLFSHDLAALAGVSAAQVRRDIMHIGYSGNPNRGYGVNDLLESIEVFLDTPGGQRAALIGVGNLGRSILSYFSGRRPHLTITAAFDSDPEKYGRVILGCRCYSMEELDTVIRSQQICCAIITTPADAAQPTADRLVAAGVRGILNFAPATVRVPANVYVEDIDMATSLEKVAYFARQPV
jgi:redox-sensing transcriptional repressor